MRWFIVAAHASWQANKRRNLHGRLCMHHDGAAIRIAKWIWRFVASLTQPDNTPHVSKPFSLDQSRFDALFSNAQKPFGDLSSLSNKALDTALDINNQTSAFYERLLLFNTGVVGVSVSALLSFGSIRARASALILRLLPTGAIFGGGRPAKEFPGALKALDLGVNCFHDCCCVPRCYAASLGAAATWTTQCAGNRSQGILALWVCSNLLAIWRLVIGFRLITVRSCERP